MVDGSPPAVHVHDLTGGRFGNDRRIEVCRQAILDAAGLDHIAHHTSGVLDFSVDVLAEQFGPDLAEEQRQLLSGLGKQLTGRFVQLDREVLGWHSGALIRLVLHGSRRLMVCNAVTTEQLVISSTPARAAGRSGPMPDPDRRAARLANELRALVNLQTQNPGGFRSARPAETSAQADQADSARRGPGRCTGSSLEVRGEPGRVLSALCGAVDPADLHFAAYIRAGVWQCSADVLGHPLLAAFFSRLTTAEVRRSSYQAFGSWLCIGPESLLGQLTLDMEDVIGKLERIVVDVEQGAFYCYRLGNDDFVLGVTLDQGEVSRADDKMAMLAGEIDQ
jgi:hypothetical protein